MNTFIHDKIKLQFKEGKGKRVYSKYRLEYAVHVFEQNEHFDINISLKKRHPRYNNTIVNSLEGLAQCINTLHYNQILNIIHYGKTYRITIIKRSY